MYLSPDFSVIPLSTGPREFPMWPYGQAAGEKAGQQECRAWASGPLFHGTHLCL